MHFIISNNLHGLGAKCLSRPSEFGLHEVECVHLISVHAWLPLNLSVMYFRDLDLKKPLYQRTAAYGHFGRDSFPWEVPKKLKY